MPTREAFLLVAVAALLAVQSAPARSEPPPGMTPPQAGPMLHGELRLSLRDAIAMGLENNLGVEVERFDPYISYEETRIAWGAYDPEFFSEFGYSSRKTPTANALAGTGATPISSQRSTDGFGGFRGFIPLLGSSYSAQFNGNRDTTNNSFIALSPELGSSYSINFIQPLMRNLIWNQEWTQVNTTRILHEAVKEEFRTAVMDTVRNIEDAYWALIAEDERRRVAEKSLETAQALLDQTQTQFEVGVVSKVEVVQAESGVAQRDFQLIGAKNRYRNAQDVLIDLVLGTGLRAESTLEIEPTDRPDDYVVYEIDLDEAVRQAFSHRPELAAAAREIERREINLKFAQNQRLPQLDAVLSYGQAGIAGDPNSRCGGLTCTPASRSTSWSKTFSGYSNANSFTARAMLSIPLPNTAARHTVSRTHLELRRARTQKTRLEQSIILGVREAARNLESAQEGIEAAERARVAAEEQLRAERIRLEYGESTPFDVLLREEVFVDAESGKIAALQVYRTSVTDLARRQGTILRNRNISIDAVGRLR